MDSRVLTGILQVSGTRYVSTFTLAHAQTRNSTIPTFIGGSAPFYSVYQCKGGGFMSVGCLEPKFFAAFLDTFQKHLPAGFLHGRQNPDALRAESQFDQESWPAMQQFLREGFMTRTRDEWAGIYAGICAIFAGDFEDSNFAA